MGAVTVTDNLDSEELMGLALDAIDRGDNENAIKYLKRALVLAPDDAMALYALGTLHASMGMHERAIEEILQVLEVQPEFHVARFQLGMIFLAHGDNEYTLEYWAPFAELDETHTFFLFRRGIEHYLNDRYAQCIADLGSSIEANLDYESVIDDMRGLQVEISELSANQSAAL
ncbi:MAG: tetratricopeptide (TPR) repeat protein [Halioglobus sp.]